MATSQIANGAAVTFSEVELAVVDNLSVVKNGQSIDVTGLADLLHYFALGIPNMEISFDYIGESGISYGDTGTLVFQWDGGTASSDSITWGCFDASQSGSVDGKLVTKHNFKPVRTPAA